MPQFFGQAQPSGAFNMVGMAGALPEFQSSRPSQVPQQGQQRQQPGQTAMNPNYSTQQAPQYVGQPSTANPNYPQIPLQYQTHYQQAAAQAYVQAQSTHHPQPIGSNPSQGGFASNPYYPSAQSQAFSYYPGQYVSQQGTSGRQGMYPTPYGRASGQAYGQGPSDECLC